MSQNWNDLLIALYDQEYERLLKSAYRMTGDQELAQDIVHQTFLLAFFRQDELIVHPKPAAWLFLTLRNLISNELRLSVHTEISLEEISDIPARASETPLDHILPAQLKEEDRKILIWRYEQRMSYKEMADQLGISEAACRNRVSRAIKKCKKYKCHDNRLA